MRHSIPTWLEVQADSDFSIHNLPFGVFSTQPNPTPRIGVAIGEYILDMHFLVSEGALDGLSFEIETLQEPVLNSFMALGNEAVRELRARLQLLLSQASTEREPIEEEGLILQSDATMHFPFMIGDYTDFYSSLEHAQNAGKLFRDPDKALFPNWRHLPVGYHGRASSIQLSGVNFHRPCGQIIDKERSTSENLIPKFSPTRALDFELEMATVIGKPSELGQRITAQNAEEHIFGFVLFNDWSARDIQRWEYQPLGPFLGKNFFSSISPWVVTFEALKHFRVKSHAQEPEVLDYLKTEGNRNFDIQLSVEIQAENSLPTVVTQTNFKHMYWNVAQQIAHHTINGCNLNTGDLLASGTISGSEPGSYGCLLEITENGRKSLTLSNNQERVFLQDYDSVIIKGWAEKDDIRVGFGSLFNKVLPAIISSRQ